MRIDRIGAHGSPYLACAPGFPLTPTVPAKSPAGYVFTSDPLPPIAGGMMPKPRPTKRLFNAQTIVLLLALILLTVLILPIGAGIVVYRFLGEYHGIFGPQRLWISIGMGLVIMFVFQMAVMVPVIAFVAARAAELKKELGQSNLADREAHALIDTLAEQHKNHQPPGDIAATTQPRGTDDIQDAHEIQEASPESSTPSDE